MLEVRRARNCLVALLTWVIFALDEFRVSDEHTADLIAAEDRAKTADRDRQAGNHFHQEFYEVMKEKVKSWEAKATTADGESNQYGSMSSDAVQLLQEVARDLDGMVLATGLRGIQRWSDTTRQRHQRCSGKIQQRAERE